MTHRLDTLISKFVRDRSGKIVLWQTPNIPLIFWFVCVVISYVVPAGARIDISSLGTAFLFVWAYMEITGGASYFRRALGFVIFCTIVVRFFL
jgi:hypothetical protein